VGFARCLALLDFGSCASGDPALDVGKFLADLEWWGRPARPAFRARAAGIPGALRGSRRPSQARARQRLRGVVPRHVRRPPDTALRAALGGPHTRQVQRARAVLEQVR